MSLHRLIFSPRTVFRQWRSSGGNPFIHTSRHYRNAYPRCTSSSSQPASSPHQQNTRIARLLLRLPPSLRPYLSPLLHAPTTHITSFLILHELTAVVPLLGLASLFHYANWLPASWTEGRLGEGVREGVERFGKWFGKKGWFGFTPAVSTIDDNNASGNGAKSTLNGDGKREISKEGLDVGALEEAVEQRWNVSSEGGRILVEVATAYAITKVLLPVRIMASVWATPWFARVVIGRVGGVFRRRKLTQVSVGAGKSK